MDTNSTSERIFKILKGNGYTIKSYDELGAEVIDPSKAERFFVANPNILVSITDDSIQLNKGSSTPIDMVSDLVTQLRRIADEQLINFTIKDFGKTLTPKHFSFQAKQNAEKLKDLSEARLGRLHGFRKTSYQNLGEVRLVYRHSKEVNEESPASRARSIRTIELEHQGERRQFPNNYVLGARALARHLHEGGTWDDPVSNYIIEMSKRCKKMKEFIRYTKSNKDLIEGNDTAVALVKENMQQIQYDFKKFIAPTTYSVFREKFENAQIAEHDGVESLRDQFTMKKFDDKFESVLPYISNLLKEKEDYESLIENQVEAGVSFRAKPAFSRVLEFEDKYSEISYKLKETSKVLESEDISVFLDRVAEKINTQQSLTEFEIKVVRGVLEQARNSALNNNKNPEIPK